ncbi:MAG: GtrA family protein [archaeon]
MVTREGTITFIKYLFFAGIATIADLSILYILTEFIQVFYFVSSIISYVCGGIIHYVLNKKYTFKNKSKKIFSQLSIFFGIALIGLGINQLILYLLVELANIWYIYAKLVAVFIVLIWNFTGHKYITFRLLK